jgi:hypothetical protein
MSVFSRWLLAAFYDFNMTNLLNAILQPAIPALALTG